MTDYFLYDGDGNDSDAGTTWALAKATLAGIIAIPVTSGDRVFVKKDHIETLGAATAYDFPEDPGLRIYCVAAATTNDPPVNSDLAEMANDQSEGWVTSGNFNFTINGSLFAFGLAFVPATASGGSASDVILGSSASFESGQV